MIAYLGYNIQYSRLYHKSDRSRVIIEGFHDMLRSLSETMPHIPEKRCKSCVLRTVTNMSPDSTSDQERAKRSVCSNQDGWNNSKEGATPATIHG
jgi:hypothetical protein